MPFPKFDPIIFEIGPFALRWYALAYIAGLWLGWWLIKRSMRSPHIWHTQKPPATPDHIDDLLLWVTFGTILGGRLGYVLFYNPAYFFNNPSEILAVWQGGMSFHGGFLGVVIAVFLFARKHAIPILSLGDMVAATAPIGIFFGRLANFINSELWGRVTDHPFGIIFPNGGPMPRHPSQLYEAALEGLVLFILIQIAIYRFNSLKKPGFTLGLFLIGYGTARIFVEQFRQPDAHIGFLSYGTTMGFWLSAPMVVIGIAFITPALRQYFIKEQ